MMRVSSLQIALLWGLLLLLRFGDTWAFQQPSVVSPLLVVPLSTPSRQTHHRRHHTTWLHQSTPTQSAESETTTEKGAATSKASSSSPSSGYFFATLQTNEGSSSTSKQQQEQQTRVLGAQELLMLPRQYGPALRQNTIFPQMNHVSVTVLSSTPNHDILKQAIERVMSAHPLLRAHVEGDGEPNKRIDLFQMVREGEPNPPTFVVPTVQTFGVDQVLQRVRVPTVAGMEDDRAVLQQSWQATMERDLNDGSWCKVEHGPLWKLEWHYIQEDSSNHPCGLMLSFNHAISDQGSANRLIDQIVRQMALLEDPQGSASTTVRPAPQDMPVSVEDSVLGLKRRWNDIQTKGLSLQTAKYVFGKAAEGLSNPVLLPEQTSKEASSSSNPLGGALTIISGRAAGGQDLDSETRRSLVECRTLNRETTTALIEQCRQQGVSMSNAFTAAVTLAASDFVGSSSNKQNRNYKILQSLDMRRFGAQLDQGTTVACMAGSHDLMHGPVPDGSGQRLRENPTQQDLFWTLAKAGKQQTADFVSSGGPQEAVKVFDFAMSISDLNNLVHLTALSKDTKGRAYSAGSTNVGVYERQEGFPWEGESQRKPLQTQYGRYQIQDVFFATPHTTSGCLFPVSCLSVNGELKLTFHPVYPIVSEETNKQFADAFIGILEAIAIGKKSDVKGDAQPPGPLSSIPENTLPVLAALAGAVAVASHENAWIDFFKSLAEMKANVDNPTDFWAALNFWIFFAVGHPILQPILWISDVLHGTPGPKVADLVPALFLAGNVLAIGAVAASKEIRNAVNIGLLAAFFTYVGAGLDGVAGLGDYNLALDDSYQGQVVKGCPAYDEVRQPSMKDFNLEKYQGLWYEQKFHDWTQFKEVYDTTLAIKLTDDGKGWVDDFAVKGPAPDAAKLSWEKSPVANGAHYFLFGRVDEKDPPGILRESGFGVEFPNYIVDVRKDPETGEYTEAIQFQCLERGGVRVFEGINFMSRNPVMSEEQLANMHARAERAGMYPYGASPEQMHTVARKLDDTPIDNNWQAMWRAIGLDKLLELLAESIEDGGR